MEAQGIIRKISIGDIKEGITYKVGQEMLGGRITIESIVKDMEYLTKYGISKYDVYVSRSDNPLHVRIWKSFEGVPVSVEYDLEEESHESSK